MSKFTKISSFKIPIVCIGNIYVGGTGKTPLSILVSNVDKNRSTATSKIKVSPKWDIMGYHGILW